MSDYYKILTTNYSCIKNKIVILYLHLNERGRVDLEIYIMIIDIIKSAAN